MNTNPAYEARMARPTLRMMVFADGENLVSRYQDMLARGYVPQDRMYHEKDVAVWNPGFTHLAQHHEILRVTYYASVVGDDARIASVRDSLRKQTFIKHMASLLPNTVTPCVFKRDKARASKGLDIRLCVDVLGHAYHRNTDAILLLTGDGDYEPLISEVLKHGVQVFLSAFSSGLNPRLRDIADAVYELDGTTWASTPTDTAVKSAAPRTSAPLASPAKPA